MRVEYELSKENYVKIEVVIDKASVEAFFFDWYSITDMVFPQETSRGVELFVSDEKVQIHHLTLTVLKKSMFPSQEDRKVFLS